MSTVVQTIIQEVAGALFLESFMLPESTHSGCARLSLSWPMQEKFPMSIMTTAMGAIPGERDLYEFHSRLNASALTPPDCQPWRVVLTKDDV